MAETIEELLISFEQKLSIINDDFDILKKTAKNLTEKIKDGKKNNENMIEQFKKYEVVESDIIKLNVGGNLFSSLKSTLIKQIKNKNGELYPPNMFEALLKGFVKPKYYEKKTIFIDRNPKHFGYILDYLRMANTECEFELSPEVDQDELKKEAKFYNIE
ncbi:unnamed protein product [Brachionus calyciflorus]|uniref:Potassium channel tetramerisation-type BTB domain-containing protein n=1 Tax=Brachionus calyciflorus TaxID=104777 RepID=A0A813Q6U4_9BILA|nr:unnamed protein product [Brachionus calyciflorus]